jgi:hypothetical protein
LDGKYLLLFARTEKRLTCLVLYPHLTTVGIFFRSALSTWVLVSVFFAMLLDAAPLSTCVIALSALGLECAS